MDDYNDNTLFVPSDRPDEGNYGLVEETSNSGSGLSCNPKWALLLIPFLCLAIIAAIVLGLIPVYLDGPDNTSQTEPALEPNTGFTDLSGAPSRRLLFKNERNKRAEGDSVRLDEGSGPTILNCDNKDVDMLSVFNKGVDTAKKSQNGETFKNPQATFTCMNNQIVQTNFAADYSSGDPTCFDMGNPVFRNCDPMGKALTEQMTCDLFKAYLNGIGKTARGVSLVSNSTGYFLNNIVYNSVTGQLDTYKSCEYDSNCVLQANSVGCKTTCCYNPAKCENLCTNEVTFEVTQVVEVGYTDTFLELKKDVPMLDDVWPCGEGDDLCIKSYLVRKVDVEEEPGAENGLSADMFKDIMI